MMNYGMIVYKWLCVHDNMMDNDGLVVDMHMLNWLTWWKCLIVLNANCAKWSDVITWCGLCLMMNFIDDDFGEDVLLMILELGVE